MKINDQRSLDDYSVLNHPPDLARLEKIEYNEQLRLLQIAIPSRGQQGKRYLTYYFLDDHRKDYCTCDGNLKYKKRCYHLTLRPLIMKLFLKRSNDDDWSWLNNAEVYGLHSIEEIQKYILGLFYFQDEVSQSDLLDHDLVDDDGNGVNRKRIGHAFRRLHKAKIIGKVRQRRAQYKTRKGGLVWVWALTMKGRQQIREW